MNPWEKEKLSPEQRADALVDAMGGHRAAIASAIRAALGEHEKELTRQTDKLQTRIREMLEAVASAATALAFSPRDQALHHRDAWVYGILCGWDDAHGEALNEVAQRHQWSEETVARLRRYRAALAKEPTNG